MGSLQLISALNWLQVVAFVAVPVAAAVLGVPLEAVLLFGLVCLPLAAPFLYLALVIEKGRGRVLQSVFSGLMLLAFPVGTAISAFTLYVLWFSEHKQLFDDVAAGYGPPPDDARDQGAEDDDGGVEETPYAFARRLADEGKRPDVVRQRLLARGLDADEVETLLGAVGLTRPGSRPPPRAAARPSKARPPPSRPPPRRR